MRTYRQAFIFPVVASLGFLISSVGCGHSAVPTATVSQRGLVIAARATACLEPQHPLDYDDLGLPNFGFVTADIWRGGEPTAEGYLLLARSHVATIIDLRKDDAQEEIPPGIVYKHFGVSGFHADQVDVAGVLRAIDQCPKPIYIHCREGRDRTGMAIAAFRLRQKMPVKDVCQELENFHVNFWWQRTIERRINELAQNGLPS